MDTRKILLSEKDIPQEWYNIVADLPKPLDPPLHPGTLQPVTPDLLAPIFPMGLIKQEVCQERWVPIPDDVLRAYQVWRPTPLIRASRLEEELAKRAQEAARYLLPLATTAYLHHTISVLTLFRYRRICRLSEAARESEEVVEAMVQALLAAKAGAAYVSPFVGRLDDISSGGMELVEQIMAIYGNYDIFTEVIVASVRHPMHVLEAALIGADIATVPFRVMEQLFKHPLTDIGTERFLKDWEKVTRKREL